MWFGNLQVCRIVAAVAVLVSHAAIHGHHAFGIESPMLGSGGIYYFRTAIVVLFAVSGFVLTHTLQSGNWWSYVGFRLLRLYPAYWVAAGLVIAIRLAFGEELPNADGLFNAFSLWPAGFGGAFYSLGVEWTLVYEVFLSLGLVPLAILGRRWGLGLGAAVWLIACLGLQAIQPGVPPQFPRYWEVPLSVVNVPFLLGVVAYFAKYRIAAMGGWAWLGVILGLGIGHLLAEPCPGWSYVVQSVGSVLGVALAATGRQIDARHPLAVAGEWSYGVYLLHVPILLTIFDLLPTLNLGPATSGWVYGAAAIAIAAGAIYGAAEWAAYRRVRKGIKSLFVPRVESVTKPRLAA